MSQQPAVIQNEWWRRPVRLAVQLAMGGALTFVSTYVIQHYGPNLGATPITFILAASTWLTNVAQTYGEKQGWIPILLPNAHPAATLGSTVAPATK